MSYWDTSALLKLYVAERDSGEFLELAARSGDPVLTSVIATAEVPCVLHRKEAAGDLRPGGAQAIFRKFAMDVKAARIITIPYGDDVAAQVQEVVALAFRRRRPVLIRSLDAIHVASALASRAKALIATDARLRQVAALAGMNLVP